MSHAENAPWFERKNGRLAADSRGMATDRGRDTGSRRLSRHDATIQGRLPGHTDGHLHARLRIRHRAVTWGRPAVLAGGARRLVGRRLEEPDVQYSSALQAVPVHVRH